MYFLHKNVNNIYERKRWIMKEKNELVLHIYEDAEMACFTIESLIKDLKEKDNKIKKTIEDILHEYKAWKQKAKTLLQKENAEISEEPVMAKIMAGVNIKKEVILDNSDSAIADMLIKGISMGSIDMEKKIKSYKDEVNKEDLKMAEEFLKFQERTIEQLKEYL